MANLKKGDRVRVVHNAESHLPEDTRRRIEGKMAEVIAVKDDNTPRVALLIAVEDLESTGYLDTFSHYLRNEDAEIDPSWIQDNLPPFIAAAYKNLSLAVLKTTIWVSPRDVQSVSRVKKKNSLLRKLR